MYLSLQGELVQRTLHIYLENCESTSDLLDELAGSILPKVHRYFWHVLARADVKHH